MLKADNTKLLKTLQDQLLTANHRIEELDVEKAEAHRQVKLLQVRMCVYIYVSCNGTYIWEIA